MAKTQSPTQQECQPTVDSVSSARVSPACFIRTNHPLALRLIEDALRSDAELRCRVSLYPNGAEPLIGKYQQILILDICSVENWAESIDQWYTEGGVTIALASEACSIEMELQLLCLGVAGVLRFTDSLTGNLPIAVRAVAEDRLWFRREVLEFFVRRTTRMLRRAGSLDQRLTARENEVAGLVQQKLTNRVIAQRLLISERTTKFHISNILRKLELASRHELRSLDASSASKCPDWLVHQAVDVSKLFVVSSGPASSPARCAPPESF